VGRNNQQRRKEKKAARAKAEAKRLPVVNNIRHCDGCTVCCSVFGVEEINKQPWEKCSNLKDTGCSIYSTRPQHCRGFYCLWQHGTGTSADRPDKLGVVFAPTNGPTDFTGEVEVQAYEVIPMAFNKPEVVKIARDFEAKGKLVIGHVHGTIGVFRFVGPPGKVLKALRWAEAQERKST
jgi:Fe-S-cluster containining protein